MQRYFVEQPFDASGQAVITGDDLKHIANVMRMTVDDQIIAVSKCDAYVATITAITTDGVAVQRVGEPLRSNEMPIHVTIACGLAKGDKHELIVQKGTELGVSAIIQLKAERSVVKWDEKKGQKKIDRLRKIAKSAAEQCHRTVIPEVVNPLTLKELIGSSSAYDVLLFADEEDAKSTEPHRIADRVKNIHCGQQVLVVFGPEGGLSRNEAEQLLAAGFLPVSLGPRILRTETAPLYVLSALSYEFE